MEEIGLGRGDLGGATESSAFRTCLQAIVTLGERQCVVGTASSHMQMRIELNTPSHSKTELSRSCSPSGGPALSNFSQLSGWLQERNRTLRWLPRDHFAPVVQRTGKGADSVVSINFRDSMNTPSPFAVPDNSGKTLPLAASDNSDDASWTRWEFLKSLTHRLIRDIAFVVSSPPLLQDSDELPTVSCVMLGGDDEDWLQNAHWLRQLDGELVESWFQARPTRNRLGDHFALCVEYVLRFLPSARIHRLVVSQQVLEQLSTAGEPHSTVSSSQATEGNSSAVLCTASFATAGTRPESKPKESSPCTAGAQLVGDVSPTSHAEVVADGEATEHVGRRKKRMLRKMQRAAAFLGVPRTIGEFDFLFELKRTQLSTGHTATDGGTDYFSQQHARNQTRSDGSRSREFDTLSITAGQVVQHWEVSVKFLLYTGPWEPFGLQTPDYASWSSIKQNQPVDSATDSGIDGAEADRQDEECDDEEVNEEVVLASEDSTLFTKDEKEVVLDSNLSLTPNLDSLNDGDKFFGCYLGPHVGESLAEKREKLCIQLALSDRPEASALVHKLFPEEAKEEESAVEYKLKPSYRTQVTPRALLNGYLFYEYSLWRILRKKQAHLEAQKHGGTGSGQKGSLEPTDGGTAPPSKAILNSSHWMGWWCRINEFIHIPFRRDSRWYIVPKLEWLSPVIIVGSDIARCVKVLDIPGLHEAAAKLSAEARERDIPRKRRVLLAEVRWESNAADSKDGRWVEASRGFMVEKSWPNSRLYQPHGFDLSWTPTLADFIE